MKRYDPKVFYDDCDDEYADMEEWATGLYIKYSDAQALREALIRITHAKSINSAVNIAARALGKE